MFSKFNKEGIITGPLDSYCLLCENYLRGQNEINHHIANPIHTENLEKVPYMKKHREDHIRKVKMGYYCEICNKLFATAAEVRKHTSEKQHNQNKGLLLLKQSSNGVVTFGNILISDAAWNGIVDGACILCNIEIENESIHKTRQNHVLNLIKTDIEFAVNSVYRKIDEKTFHCLTCNKVLAIKRMDDHFAATNHRTKLRKCDPVLETSNKTEPGNKSTGETKVSTGAIPKSNVNDSKKATPAADKSANNPMEYDTLTMASSNSNVRKVSFHEFATSYGMIENILIPDVVLNESLCITLPSFLFVNYIDEDNTYKWRCYSCDSVYENTDIENHKNTAEHQKFVTDAQVVVVDTEFIREVRPDVYHCGFCNIVESGWDDMESHLSSVQHKKNKINAEWRLCQHSSEIQGNKMRQNMQKLMLFLMMAGNKSSSDSDSDC